MGITLWVSRLRRPKAMKGHCLECGGKIDLLASKALYGREYCSQECLLDAAEKRGWQIS